MIIMKKILTDVKSFVTIIMTIAFVIFTFMKIVSGEEFFSIFQIIIAFYFGTQYQKNVTKIEKHLKDIEKSCHILRKEMYEAEDNNL